LNLAKQLSLSVIGTSFHIGSGCYDVQSYDKAIALCRSVFDLAENMQLPRFSFLDLGGGFPGNPRLNEDTGPTPSFEKFAAVIRSSLEAHFPFRTHGDVRVIAEPGRYMATAYSTLFVHVQGKREEPTDTCLATTNNASAPRKFLYYVNDGVYGSFNCILFDHAHPLPVPAYRFMKDLVSLDRRDKLSAINSGASSFVSNSAVSTNLITSSISSSVNYNELSYVSARGIHSSSTRDTNCVGTFFGPTCDSLDVIAKNHSMEELFVGDWLAFAEMGAYTNAAATTFNGMPRPQIFYARSKQASPKRSA